METYMKKYIFRNCVLLLGLFLYENPVLSASLVSAKKVEITVDPEKTEVKRLALWKKIGGWCAVLDWHPSVSKCVEKKEGDQLLRVLTFKDGNTSTEKLLDRGTSSYTYEILETTYPVKSFQSMFSVSPDDEDLDELQIQWSATYDAKQKDEKEVRKLIDKVLADGIDNLKIKFDLIDVLQKDTD